MSQGDIDDKWGEKSNPIDDGGPAFPINKSAHYLPNARGMSLRDWFAGQALGGPDDPLIADSDYDDVARVCYEYADAMLREREKRK